MAELLAERAKNAEAGFAGEHIRWDVSRMCRVPQGTRLLYRPGDQVAQYPVLQVLVYKR